MIDDLQDLPPEVAAEIESARQLVMQRLDDFAQYVAGKRDEAVQAREASGIEDIWRQAEEAYLGIDDLNRNEWTGAKWAQWIKSPNLDGPLRRSRPEDEMRSTLYPRLTARYVDAGTAKLCEILIPIDGKTFSLQPTPVPELSKALDDAAQVVIDGEPKMRPATPEDMPPGAAPEQAPKEVPLTVKDLAKHKLRMAEEAAEEASDIVHDWLVECRHTRTLRKAIFDGARLGTMVVKGPIPTRKRAVKVSTEGGIRVDMETKVVPTTSWVSPWNCYPDPACGEDVQQGSYFVECDDISERGLKDLRNQKGYIPWTIDRVIEEGPDKANTRQDGKPQAKGVYKVWTFWGCIDPRQLKLTNPELYEAHRSELGQEVYAIVTLVNDTPIKVALNPLKSGKFPHKVAVWRRRHGFWAGQGVAEQMRAPQAMMTGAVRAMVNNAGKSAGAQIVVNTEVLVPSDQHRTIYGDKQWEPMPGASIEDVSKAFQVFTIPNCTPQLLSIIEFAFRLAEESTSIPLITQGQSGDTTPDTFGATQIQNNNANQLLRDVGFGVAEDLTEPLVQDFYEWALLDPNVPDSAKGDMQADVSGSIALVEKAIQDQTIMGLGSLVGNAAFGIDPRRWMVEYLRSKRLTPSLFKYSEAEQEQIDKQPPPENPTIAAAKIRAEATVAAAQSRDALAAEKVKADIDRDTAHVIAQTERTKVEREAQIAELQIRREIALLGYANQQQISLDKVKADLAKATMEMSLQRELAGKDGKGPQVADPVVEPEGRAPDGESYQK